MNQNLSAYMPSLQGQNPWSTATKGRFFSENPYQQNNDLQGYARRVGSMGAGLLGQQNPFGAGGMLAGGPGAAMGRMGYNDSYPDINNPNTVSTTGKWMSHLRGGQQNLLNQAADQMSNQSIAGSRYGVRGGVDPRSAQTQQVFDTLAGQYGKDFSQSIEWQRQKALYDQSNYQNYANSLADVYKAQLGAGSGLVGNQLDALRALMGQDEAERARKYGAYSDDVQNYNASMGSIPGLLRQQYGFDQSREGQTEAAQRQADLMNRTGAMRQRFNSGSYSGNNWAEGVNAADLLKKLEASLYAGR